MGERGVGRISILFSWYPHICFQKLLQVSQTFNYSLTEFFRPSWVWRNEFRLLGKMTVLNFSDEYSLKAQGDLQPLSGPGHPPHHSLETNWGPSREGQPRQCPKG